MKPAWSVILFTTLAGAGQGLFLALVAADAAGAADRDLLVGGAAVSVVLLAAGLLASFFHLGRPARAWRTAAMWRSSWLSREVIVLPAFMACVAAYGLLAFLGRPALAAALVGTLLCLLLFLCTGMIYACLPFLQEWRTPLTPLNFLALGCASGLTLAAALSTWLLPALAQPYAAAALAIGAAAYALRIASLVRNRRLRPKSTPQSAIGVRHARVTQIAQGAMGGSFNTREFFHGRGPAFVRAMRWLLLALVFPVPAVLLVLSPGLTPALAAAFVVQYAGLLAERWYFFAEARHPQNLYYQAIA